MKYRSAKIRDALAAEYVLGTLPGLVRRRFERPFKDAQELRRAIAAWQEALAPLNDSIEPVAPPAHVWRRIQSRVGSAARRRGAWARVGFWRMATVTSSAAALLMAAWMTAFLPSDSLQKTMVSVLLDGQSTPGLVVSWAVRDEGAERLRVRVMGHPVMESNTAWELWMLPRGGGKPVSLGLIDTQETQLVTVPGHLAAAVNAAWGLAMSVEPLGGSATGLPTGPVLFKGRCTPL
jgi:anti-sigma-K factor RskA